MKKTKILAFNYNLQIMILILILLLLCLLLISFLYFVKFIAMQFNILTYIILHFLNRLS